MHRSVAILLVLATPSFADECQSIADRDKRLDCYDTKAAAANAGSEVNSCSPDDTGKITCTATTTVAEAPKSKWKVDSRTSAMADTTDIFMTIESNENVLCQSFESTPGRIFLMARCMENTTAVMIGGNCHLASGFQGYGDVEYRLDDTKVKTKGFDVSTDNQALGLWSGGQAIPFLEAMMEHDVLRMRFTPFGMSRVEVSFDIAGMDEDIKPLREACGW